MTENATYYPVRNAEIYHAHEAGQTLRSLAALHGLSVERVRQIHAREGYMRRQERLERPLNG